MLYSSRRNSLSESLCVPVRAFGFPDGIDSNIWSTVMYTEIGFDMKIVIFSPGD